MDFQVFLAMPTHLNVTNDFESLRELEDRILGFQKEYEKVSKPFKWKFTRNDLKNLLSKFDEEQKLAA